MGLCLVGADTSHQRGPALPRRRGDDADGDRCTCWCGCRRRAPWGEDECRRCQADRHRDDG